jgi:hypothetical protein
VNRLSEFAVDSTITKRLTGIALILAISMMSACDDKPPQTTAKRDAPNTAKQDGPNEATPEGPNVQGMAAQIRTDKSVYRVGEKITLTFTIHNHSPEKTYLLFVQPGFASDFADQVTIKDGEGRELKFYRRVPAVVVLTAPRARLISIAPGGIAQESIELSSWDFGQYTKDNVEHFLGDEAGLYTIAGHVTTTTLESADKPGVGGDLQAIRKSLVEGGRQFVGDLDSSTVTINVVPASR